MSANEIKKKTGGRMNKKTGYEENYQYYLIYKLYQKLRSLYEA